MIDCARLFSDCIQSFKEELTTSLIMAIKINSKTNENTFLQLQEEKDLLKLLPKLIGLIENRKIWLEYRTQSLPPPPLRFFFSQSIPYENKLFSRFQDELEKTQAFLTSFKQDYN